MYEGRPAPGIKSTFGDSTVLTVPFYQQVTVTSGAANTKGSWVELESATDHEVNGMHFMMYNLGLSGSTQRSMIDIGIGAAASETVLIPNIILGTPSNFGTMTGDMMFFPVRIPAGTRVAVRMQSTAATVAGMAIAFFSYGDGLAQTYTGCDVLGATAASTSGVTVTSGSGAYGAYTTIDTLTREYKALMPLIAVSTSATANSFVSIDVAVNRGTDVSVFRRGFRSKSVDIVVQEGNPFPYYGNFFSGDILKSRIWASSVVPFNTTLYAFY